MKYYQYLTFLFFLSISFFTFIACNDDESPIAPIDSYFENVNTVTGLYLYDINASGIGKWRQPNVKKSEEVNIYPIPASDVLNISSNLHITNVWIIEAACYNEDTENIEELSQALSYEKAELVPIEFTATFSSPTDNFQINLEAYEKGFYRLFYEINNDQIYWENLYVDPAVSNFPDFNFLDDLCQ